MPMLPAMIRRQEEAPPRGSTGSFSLLPPRANSPTGSHCSFQASTPPASAPHSPSGYLQKFSTKVFRWLIMLTFLYMYCICILYMQYCKILSAGLSGVGAGAHDFMCFHFFVGFHPTIQSKCRGSFVAGMGIPMTPVMPPSPSAWMSPSQAEEKEHLEAWR